MAILKWWKLLVDMHDDEKMKLIDAMPERDVIHYIWIRLLSQACKTNDGGYVYLSKDIAYSNEMLANIFNRSVDSISLALKTFTDLKMIKINKKNLIFICNWEKHQNIDAMEKYREKTKARVRKHRKNKALEKKPQIELDKEKQEECNVTVTAEDQYVTVQKEEEDLDTRYINISSKKEKEEIHLQGMKLINHYENVLGRKNIFNPIAINYSIEVHGYEYVKMAIDKAIEANKVSMGYINGILNNWKKESYPEKEVLVYDKKQENNRESDSKFKDFRHCKHYFGNESFKEFQDNIIL